MDDLLVARRVDADGVELLELVAHADDDVGLVEPEVDVVVAHEAHRTKRMGVIVGEHALAVEGRRHREAELLGEAPQRVAGTGAGCSVPGQDDRPLARVEDGPGPLDLRRRRLVRPGCVDVQRPQPIRDLGYLDVLGDTEVDGAGPFGLGQLERLADHLGYRAGAQNQVRPLGHRGEHRDQIDALMGLLVDPAQPDLRRQGDQRRAVGIGIGRAQEQVDRARSECGRADAGPTSDAAEDLGHERRRLLVPHQHVADGRPRKGLGEVDVLFSGYPEHTGDPFVLQAVYEELRDAPCPLHHVTERTAPA